MIYNFTLEVKETFLNKLTTNCDCHYTEMKKFEIVTLLLLNIRTNPAYKIGFDLIRTVNACIKIGSSYHVCLFALKLHYIKSFCYKKAQSFFAFGF